jgi:hypothetical protein
MTLPGIPLVMSVFDPSTGEIRSVEPDTIRLMVHRQRLQR